MSIVALSKTFTLPNGCIVRNRLVKSAMSEALGTSSQNVTPELAVLYRRWAEGGIGLSITGNVMIDRRALGEPGNVVVEDDRDIELLRRWAEAGKINGAQIWMQINHPGKQAPSGLNKETVAPSAISFGDALSAYFAPPRELRDDEIMDIIRRFGVTARIAKSAGFNGVQIHGAHGYLVSQFLSARHNQRTDRWGGTPEKRRAFVLAVVAEIRKQTGSDFSVGIKLNSADFQKGGFSEEESLDTLKALETSGICLVEISGGNYEAPAMTGKTTIRDSTKKREAYFLEFAERARKVIKTPLILTGGFRTPEVMAAAIDSGAIDFVGLGRSLAVEPDLPERILRGLGPRYKLQPRTTGIKLIDRFGFLEITWYTRQLQRMSRGHDPKPDESPLISFFAHLLRMGWKTFTMRKMRA